MRVAYNEIDRYCCDWLENLMSAGAIPIGKIFDCSIEDLTPGQLAPFDQVHFFAGVGVWAMALEMAGWNAPCFTGSCPCQPWSVAGKRKGFDDPRHLWPAWRRIIEKRHPAVVFGEQVARAPDWFRLVRSELVEMDYAVGAVPIEAACIGARHLRDRLWFVADASGSRLAQRQEQPTRQEFTPVERSRLAADADGQSLGWTAEPRAQHHHWSAEPGMGRVADGVSDRRHKLRALGNAIVPQVAATFVSAYTETLNDR